MSCWREAIAKEILSHSLILPDIPWENTLGVIYCRWLANFVKRDDTITPNPIPPTAPIYRS